MDSLLAAVATGDSGGHASCLIGLRHQGVIGNIAADKAEAARWYRRSVAAGNLGSAVMLGRLCVENEDHVEAFKLFARAVACPDKTLRAEAMFRVAEGYRRGVGIALDHRKAFRFFSRAAEEGHSTAMLMLAAYCDGEDAGGSAAAGVEVDPAAAFAWMRRAADSGDAEACNYLAYRSLNGHGVETDARKAHACFVRAAAADFFLARSALILAQMFEDGQGCDADAAAALVFYKRAAAAAGADENMRDDADLAVARLEETA